MTDTRVFRERFGKTVAKAALTPCIAADRFNDPASLIPVHPVFFLPVRRIFYLKGAAYGRGRNSTLTSERTFGRRAEKVGLEPIPELECAAANVRARPFNINDRAPHERFTKKGPIDL